MEKETVTQGGTELGFLQSPYDKTIFPPTALLPDLSSIVEKEKQRTVLPKLGVEERVVCELACLNIFFFLVLFHGNYKLAKPAQHFKYLINNNKIK